nr:hypothetical protein [Tanacetum cinerariifolium]
MASFDYRLNPFYPIKECLSCGALYTTDYCCSDGSLGTRSFVILIKHPTCLNDPLRIVLSVETRLMVIIVRDVLFYERNLRKICLHIVLKMEFSKILSSHLMTIPTLLMLIKSHSLAIKTPIKIPHKVIHKSTTIVVSCVVIHLEDIFCHNCTCELCGRGAHYGYNFPSKVLVIPDLEPFNNETDDELLQILPCFDPTCYSEDGNSFTYDSTSNLVHDSPNVFNPPLQPLIYSYEFCGNDAYYGHDCSLQVPFTYDPEPCYNQDFNFP